KAPLANSPANAYFGAEYYGTKGYVEAPQDFHRVNLFAKGVAPVGHSGTLTASLSSFSSDWEASGQIPTRAVENGMITRYGSIDPTEGGATSRSTITLGYKGEGGSPFSISGSFTDYRFRLYSNFTFFAND